MELSLSSKVALITGGSRGIGAATVRLFVGAGAKVVFNYQSAKAKADELVRECGTASCRAVQSDLSTAEAAKELVAAALAAFGRLDILVVNHGIWPPEDVPIDRMTEEQWHRTIAVNLDSVFGLVKYAVGQMKKQGGHPPPHQRKIEPDKDRDHAPQSSQAGIRPPEPAGHIVLVSSTAGQRGESFHTHYGASKGAIISLTKGLATELARHGILVNSVAPGWVATDMSNPVLNTKAGKKMAGSVIPLGRPATAEEVAGPILFLASDLANFVHGEVLNVNGGSVLCG